MSTVQLEGEAQFMYIVQHFKSSLSEALKTMEEHNQDMAWFYSLDGGMQTAIKVNDPYLTDYIRGEARE